MWSAHFPSLSREIFNFLFLFSQTQAEVCRRWREKKNPSAERATCVQRVCANKKRTRQHSNGTNCSSWEIIPGMGFLCFLLLFLTRGRMNKSNNSFLIYLFQRFFFFYDNEFCVLSSCQAFDEYIQIVMDYY